MGNTEAAKLRRPTDVTFGTFPISGEAQISFCGLPGWDAAYSINLWNQSLYLL